MLDVWVSFLRHSLRHFPEGNLVYYMGEFFIERDFSFFLKYTHIYGAWPLTDPGVELERAVPEVSCSSRRWRRSGEGVAELKSKRRGRRGVEVS